jgi:rRNA-processing protein EBP2
MAFYNQTMSAVVAGRASMQAAGLPVRRPNDYFCENVKSDAHMTKVRTVLHASFYCGLGRM